MKKIITKREKEVLKLLIKGLSNSEIASALKITIHTVKAHVSSMYKKTKTDCRVTLAVKAIKSGLIEE